VDIVGKLVPLASKLKRKLVNSVSTVEDVLLRLPRPLRESTVSTVSNGISTSLGRAVTSIISLRTGKSILAIGVKNRELNKFGRAGLIVGLATSSAVIVLSVHEIWARSHDRAEQDFQHLFLKRFDSTDAFEKDGGQPA